MKNRFHQALGLLALFAHTQYLQAEEQVDFLDMDLETLMSIKVGPSADASAKGLSTPYSGGQVASGGRIGILGTRDIMETPFSVTHYTRDFIQDHQAISIGDVIQYDPSVRVARGFGNFQQVYLIRGFPLFSDDMTYNGLYGILPRQYLAAELIERVTVLRGPSAFLNGSPPGVSGGFGGAIDAIPKRAPKKDIAKISLGVRDIQHHYAAVDLGMRSETGRLGIRLNGVHSEGDTALEDESRRLEMGTLGLDYRGEALRISADFGHQDHLMDAAQPSITFGSGLPIPPAPDAGRNIAQPWTFSDNSDLFGTLRAEYEFNPDITGWVALGARDSNESSSLSAFLTVFDNEGNFSANRFDVIHEDAVTTGELGLRASVPMGNIKHEFTVSANAYQNRSHNAYIIYEGFINNIHQPTDVAPPVTPLFIGGDLNSPRVTNSMETRSLVASDTLYLLDKNLLLTLGARHQHFIEENYDYNTGAELSRYDENRLTPMAAALFKLSSRYSVYAHYAEGLLKGDIAPLFNNETPISNGGEALKPYQTRQLESGIKVDGKMLGGSLGLFEIRKPLAGVNNNNRFTILNHQSNTGLEATIYGQASPNLKILGGINLLDTNINARKAIGTPELQANLDVDWDIRPIEGLAISGHWMYTGEQYVNPDNSQKVPSWQRLDLGLRYSMKLPGLESLTLRLRVENLTGENYWASVGGFPNSNYLTLGAPRSWHLVTSLAF